LTLFLKITLLGQLVISKIFATKKQPILLDCHVVTPAKLFLLQKICKYCLNAFVNFFLQKTLQIDN